MPLTKSALRVSLEGLALAALLSVALPAATFAQDAPRTREAPRVEGQAAPADASEDSAAVEFTYSTTIPTIETVGSNVDEDTIRTILTGGLADHAAELAGLTAKSIVIPEITLEYSSNATDGADQSGRVVYRDIALTDVTNGVAASAVIGSAEVDAGSEGKFAFGKMSTDTFDLGGMLAFYGMVPGAADQPLKTIYKNFKLEGGTFTAPDATCTIGSVTTAEFKARPLKTGFGEIMTLAQTMETSSDSEMSPEDISKLVTFYADLLSAFESSPMEFAGLNCTGTSEDDKPVTVAIGPITIGGFAKNTYPEIAAKDIKVNVEGDSFVNLASLVFKSFDFSSSIAALQEAEGQLDETWLETNGRRLIPSFGGFSFSGLDMDVADTDKPGERVKASVGSFDLTLANYVNGVPADISSSAKNIVVGLPADSEDDTVKQLLTLGIDKIEAGYDLAAAWDETSSTIAIKNLSFNGANLGALALAGTLGNATADIFDTDTDTALMAAMGLTVKDVKVGVTDAGLADIMFQSMATEQGQTVGQVRTALSGVAAGTALALLGATPDAQKLSAALASFISGGAKSLSVTATAKDEAGLGLPELTAIQANPMALSSHVAIDAMAE